MSTLAIHGGLPVRTAPFPGREAGFGDEELAQLTDVIRSGQLFRYGGTKVAELETRFAESYGVRHAVACTSGTAAIHIALGALCTEPGDEVIVAPVTDAGGIIPVVAQNAIPVPADTRPRDLRMSPEVLDYLITDRTRAVVPVHVAGYPVDLDPMIEVCEHRGVCLIEDVAQAHRTIYKGRLCGTMGRIGCFSMQQSKHMATGDGGICVTNDDDLAERMRLFADKGWSRSGGQRDYPMFGMNYRMNELTAAVALAQLGKVEGFVARRSELGDLLSSLIADIEGIHLMERRADDRTTYWLFPMYVEDGVGGHSPQRFAEALSAEGVPAGHGYIGRPMHLQFEPVRLRQVYGTSHCPWDCPHASRRVEYGDNDCPNAQDALSHLVHLNINEFFSENDIEDIAAAIRKVAGA